MRSTICLASFLLVVAVVLPPSLQAQGHGFPLTSICDVRSDTDADCIADAAASADTVCVQGVVLTWKLFGAAAPGVICNTSSGCCVSVTDLDAVDDFARFTRVEVCGWVGDLHGTTVIGADPVHGTDPTVESISFPAWSARTTVYCDDLADGSAEAEMLESRLVGLCGTFDDAGGIFALGDTTYTITDMAGGRCQVRVDGNTDLGGELIPYGLIEVMGPLGQFQGAGPDCSGYAIQPRGYDDLTPLLAVESRSWGNVKVLYRQE